MKNQFRDIELSNFRGFDHIEISALSKINVFVGANNVGKTSVLEAVFMLAGMSNPFIPTRVNYLRALSAVNADLNNARYLFHNMDFNNAPLLRASIGDGVRRLTFSPTMRGSDEPSNGTSIHSDIIRLDFKFDTNLTGDFNFQSALFLGSDGSLQQTIDNRYTEGLNCLFISTDKNDGNATNNFASIVKYNKKQLVVEALHDLDPAIETIEALPDGLYLKLRNMCELLPISMAGDGIRRMINIISSVFVENYNILLVDEIDNGMHYSAHKLLWSAIMKFVVRHDIQMFVTTHNIECLQSLANAMKEAPEFQAVANVYNIARTAKEGFQAYRYSYDELKEAIDNEMEIRR